jgi:glutathione S-transferase
VLTLWQAEWCPYSARIRETLTELRVDFVAKQVAADSTNRDEMRAQTGKDVIPLLVLEDGTQIADWKAAIAYLTRTYPRPDDADRHRQKWFDEAAERDPRHVLT